jgi:hypothetical protein
VRRALTLEELAARLSVTLAEGKGFGSGTLKTNNKIFAMLSGGRLVVKLPAARVSELVAAGAGEHFDGGKGKPMKEWFALDPASGMDWEALAREALRFVGR